MEQGDLCLEGLQLLYTGEQCVLLLEQLLYFVLQVFFLVLAFAQRLAQFLTLRLGGLVLGAEFIQLLVVLLGGFLDIIQNVLTVEPAKSGAAELHILFHIIPSCHMVGIILPYLLFHFSTALPL